MESEVEWNNRKTVTIGGSCKVEILSRAADFGSALENSDFLPFSQPPTLIKWGQNGQHEEINGLITTITGVKEKKFIFKDESDKSFEIDINPPFAIDSLVVWRIDNCLDLLQYRLQSKQAYIYLQTGGEAFMNKVLAFSDSDSNASDLQRAFLSLTV